MRTYTKPTFMDRVKMAAIWIALGSVLMWAVSCGSQKELAAKYERDQEYLSYRGARPANQDLKVEHVNRSNQIRINQRREAKRKAQGVE